MFSTSVFYLVDSIRLFIAPSQRVLPSPHSCGESYTNLNLEDTALSSHGTQIILLPLGSCCRDRLNTVEIGFRVGKLFAQVDLQAPLFVGDSVFDEDRFANDPGPE